MKEEVKMADRIWERGLERTGGKCRRVRSGRERMGTGGQGAKGAGPRKSSCMWKGQVI